MTERNIEKILKDNTDKWMRIPGVEGIAIGEYKGISCIRVFTSIPSKEIQDKIPSSVEGHPIRIEKTGPFGALDR